MSAGEKGKTHFYLLGLGTAASALQTVKLCYKTIYHRSNGVKSKAGES